MKSKYRSSWALLLSLFILSGCTVQLVSDYDSRTDQSISSIRAQLTNLFFELEEQQKDESKCTYENHSGQYKQLWVDMELMAMRERTKSNNDKTKQMVEVLDEGLKKLQKTHKKGCLNRLQIRFINKSLTGLLDSILRFEIAKLRGAVKPVLLPTSR